MLYVGIVAGILILLLLVMLMRDGADMNLMLALVYLLI
jgi:hypothetical protein